MTARPSFGIYLPMTGRDLSAGELLAELVEEVQHAENAGFDVALVPEHHDGPGGSVTAPMTVTAWLLARTERIRVGPGVLLLPLYHPIHVAEWSSLLQHASGNRLILGVGTGYQQHDFDRFDVERAKRVEMLETGLTLLHDGWRGLDVPGGVLVPHLAPGHDPPIWLGAWSRKGLSRAARLADAWLVDPMRTVPKIEAMAKLYQDAVAEVGGQPEVVVIRELWVDETTQRARDRYRPLVEPVLRYYVRRGAVKGNLADLELLLDERVICGSAEVVTERIVDLMRRTTARTAVFTLRQPGGPSHREVLRAIERLGDTVLPAVRRELATNDGGKSA